MTAQNWIGVQFRVRPSELSKSKAFLRTSTTARPKMSFTASTVSSMRRNKNRMSILRLINMVPQIKRQQIWRECLPSGFCPLLIFWTKSSRSVRRPPIVWTDLIRSGYSSLSKWLYTNSSADSNVASVRTMCSKGMLGNAKDGVKYGRK